MSIFDWEKWGFRYFYLGPLCVIIHMRAGWHFSLGFDIEIFPWELNVFIMWWCIQILSHARGKEREQYDVYHEQELREKG